MIIDFHTHIYPDKIAKKVEAKAKNALGDKIQFFGPMSLSGLLEYMEKCRIDKAVAFCVSDKPETVILANDFIISVTDNHKIIGFGTILPQLENAVDEVKRIKDLGLKGIKFHSIFQNVGAYDEKLFPIYEEMTDKMIALFHSGINPAHPEKPPKTTPKSISKTKELFPKLKIVAAHLGGLGMLEESEEWLIGKDIFIDISWAPDIRSLDPRKFVNIIRKHGVEKVLFATDYPATIDPKEQINWLSEMPLTDEEKEMILGRNAKNLLQL